jgi:hypothetical protein
MTDFRVQGTSSNFVVLRPLNEPAESWLEKHTDPEAVWWAGGIAVEHRYVEEFFAAIEAEGFTIS